VAVCVFVTAVCTLAFGERVAVCGSKPPTISCAVLRTLAAYAVSFVDRNVLACGEYDKVLYRCAKPHRARAAGARNTQTALAILFAPSAQQRAPVERVVVPPNSFNFFLAFSRAL
jgi:hypothetical protein